MLYQGVMGRRDESKVKTRAAILTVARTLFHEHGYQRIGVREVAASAGFSVGAIFANWPSKADLWREAMGSAPPEPGGFALAVLSASDLGEVRSMAQMFLREYLGATS